jgi:hypothetical protein
MKDQKLIRFDWAIKTILRDKANFDVLEGFLSALLKEDIKVVQLLESESTRIPPDKNLIAWISWCRTAIRNI